MWKNLKTGFLLMVAMTVITGLAYPAMITVVAQTVFRDAANGSLLSVNGTVVGSRLLGQNFTRLEYFHPRPSGAGSGYDATASGGSNLGPTNAKLFNGTIKLDDRNNEIVDFDGVKLRIVHYCVENGIPLDGSRPLASFTNSQGTLDDVALIKAFNDERTPLTFQPRTPLPADAVTASASGLDPDISPRNAELQTARVASARGVSVERVQALVARHTRPRTLGIFGEPTVNVLELNLALDEQFRAK